MITVVKIIFDVETQDPASFLLARKRSDDVSMFVFFGHQGLELEIVYHSHFLISGLKARNIRALGAALCILKRLRIKGLKACNIIGFIDYPIINIRD